MMLWPLLSGFLGGVIAWLVTTAFAEPFKRFLQLREDAARALAEFETMPWIRNPEANPPSDDWLNKRREAYDRAGIALIAFATSNSFLGRILIHKVLGRYRYYVQAAGLGLRTLAVAYPGTQSSETCYQSILRQLHLKNLY
jgi:hypothetical protein